MIDVAPKGELVCLDDVPALSLDLVNDALGGLTVLRMERGHLAVEEPGEEVLRCLNHRAHPRESDAASAPRRRGRG